MSFNDFNTKNKLKNKTKSFIKIQQIVSSLSLSDVGIYLKDGSIESDIGIVNLHPFQGTHWLLHIHECYFDSYNCKPPQKLSRFIIKRIGHCLYSEYKIQCLTSKRDSYCAAFCLYIINFTIVVERDFKLAVLNIYYQMT